VTPTAGGLAVAAELLHDLVLIVLIASALAWREWRSRRRQRVMAMIRSHVVPLGEPPDAAREGERVTAAARTA